MYEGNMALSGGFKNKTKFKATSIFALIKGFSTAPLCFSTSGKILIRIPG
jgi:hypothetical protein